MVFSLLSIGFGELGEVIFIHTAADGHDTGSPSYGLPFTGSSGLSRESLISLFESTLPGPLVCLLGLEPPLVAISQRLDEMEG
jgi:hypothetical protein